MSVQTNPKGALAVLDAAVAQLGCAAAVDLTEARAAIAELIEALDDDLNGDDPAEWCDDHASAKVERERVTKARRERLIAALARVGGGK